jgi:hypothetical protein
MSLNPSQPPTHPDFPNLELLVRNTWFQKEAIAQALEKLGVFKKLEN